MMAPFDYSAVSVGDDALDVPAASTAKRAAENARPYLTPGEVVIVRGPRGGVTRWVVGAAGAFQQ